jgi:GDPmannose 4,6-dehydratase
MPASRPRALVTGITGQDGSYLTRLLLSKGYEVHGIKRRSSQFNTQRIDDLYSDPIAGDASLFLHYGDMTDSTSLVRIVQSVQPAEIYNLAAQSHVDVSFEQPEYTADANALGTLRILEAVRLLGLKDSVRFLQASSSEQFGNATSQPQSERTAFYPRSPYGTAKLFAHWITVNYREAFGFFASTGIFFNHESPVRGETFVTRKITRGLARIFHGLQDCLWLGNLEARRDWGHASDYVNAMWMVLQQPAPADFVFATGQSHSVREFVEAAALEAGFRLEWAGHGTEEHARIAALDEKARSSRASVGQVIVRIDQRYFRPAEVDYLSGDSAKAREMLGWRPTVPFQELVKQMVVADLANAAHDRLRASAQTP